MGWQAAAISGLSMLWSGQQAQSSPEQVASHLDIDMITASDMPYFNTYHVRAEEKDLLSHKKKVPYARQRMIEEGIKHR